MTIRRLRQTIGILGQGVAYACGFAALVVVIRQIAFLVEFVTVGPLPMPTSGTTEGLALYRGFEAVGLGWWLNGKAWPAGLVLLGGAGVLANRVRQLRNPHAGAMVMQVAALVAALGWSYRFAGLIAAVTVIVWQWRRASVGRLGWAAWALAVALCWIPYDVTCRRFDGPPHFESLESCETVIALREYAANRRVCSTDGMYNEPIGAWVW